MAKSKIQNRYGNFAKSLKWNGEIKFGDVLTTVTIIIAFLALLYQRKDLVTKVDDLRTVVQKLENEKSERELQGIQNETNRLKSFSQTLQTTSDEIESMNKNADKEFISTLTHLNSILNMSKQHLKLSKNEYLIISLLQQSNNAKKEIYAHHYIYFELTEEFRTLFKPKEKDFKNHDDYSAATKKYSDTLQKHTEYLIHRLDSLVQEPAKKLASAEAQLNQLKVN